MDIFKLWNNIYQAEADADAGSPAAAAPADAPTDTPAESLLDDATPSLADGEWFQSDGIKGTGDKPEWYQADHFKNANEQAKAYGELQSKFGSFTGTPKEGYKLPEGIEADDELAKAYIEFATNSHMNQEGFDKGFELLSAQMGVSEDISTENEMSKLGDNANERVKTVERALKFKLGEGYDEVKDLIYSADGVKLAEALIKSYAPKKLPIDGGENPTGITWADIEAEMFKKDDHGQLLRSVNIEHAAKIKRMQEEFGGNQPNVEVIG